MGLFAAAFGIGQTLGGLGAPRSAAKVTDAENAFNKRVADITAKRVGREGFSALQSQFNQNAGLGGSQHGSILLVAADDARKARQRVTNVFLQESQRALGNQAGNPSQASVNSSAFGKIAGFGAKIYNSGLF